MKEVKEVTETENPEATEAAGPSKIRKGTAVVAGTTVALVIGTIGNIVAKGASEKVKSWINPPVGNADPDGQ